MTSQGVGSVGQSAAQYLQQLTGQQSGSGGAQGAHHRHHHGGGGGGGAAGGAAGAGSQQQVSSLLDTIASALQSADPSADPNQVIEDTVTNLLQSGTTGANGASSSVSPLTVQAAGGQASNQQSFVQLLQAHGVNLQQFQSDLLTAVKDAQNGKVNPATALQSLPPGSALNLTA
jgi:hypothetical protein